MNDAERSEILPWDPAPIISFFTSADPKFTYREEFIQLILESRHCFVAGCPRASMVVAGEALLRALFEIVVKFANAGHEASISRGRRGTFTVSPNMDDRRFFGLNDDLTFNDTLGLLTEMEAVPKTRMDTLHVIKSMRNRAIHGTMPLITEWDPDEPRPGTDWIFDDSVTFPEGYQFSPHMDRADRFTFDCRQYSCGSLKPLTAEEQLAAIQYLIVTDSIGHLIQSAV
jgi:hypothetical protein